MPAPQYDPLAAPELSEPVRALARRGEICRYPKGAVLIQEGEVGATLYIVLQGRLRAYGSCASSDRSFTYGTYGAGDYVGEMGLDGGPRSASVVTLEATVCAVITRRTLEAHLDEHPRFAFELLAKVIRRARAATLSAKQMALNDVYVRLRFLLDTLAVAQPDGSRLVAPRQTQREIADQIGCTREMVGRLMKDLQAGGHLVDDGTALRLPKPLPPRW
ncbi:cAMP-binding proteins - catabolite gene activator and regulatory subunit of cAMP-dependent protein kinases [Rubrivivax sp. A210]|uniref:Crp/Fnr family transcriptional regulator n=1 Tax=Rubrivivax sp. A210 TaxID=2772301 RepID=UPI00191A04C8|nr:Crp/Fnr family transcriptional regulator [Rubrivivax sp. A210]CAD5373437.1 cAMP-binding proteins - catabolite gene activator and regulatory subunit of cAMP-dependent protein kinases [Rubrivivax sp. A210]